jgi:hypothetical protein
MRSLFIDSSLHSMRIMSIAKKEDTKEEGYQMWKYMYLNGLMNFIYQFDPDEIVIAVDDNNYWRRKIFPWYKGHRKYSRNKEDNNDSWFDYKEYFSRYETLLDEIREIFPFKVIKVNSAEADDIIGVLVSLPEFSDREKIFVTVDGDFTQLLRYPNVKFWDPVKRRFIECEDPKTHMLMKIFRGDDGDFVPSIEDKHVFKNEFLQYCVEQLKIASNNENARVLLENDEKLFYDSYISFFVKYGIKPSRCTKFSVKKANDIINTDTIKQFLSENKELKKKFLRNNSLVNLSAQPEELKNDIINSYVNCEIKLGNFFKYFIDNGFNGFLGDMNRISSTLKNIEKTGR